MLPWHTQSLDHLSTCSRDTLECTAHSTKDTIALEHLARAIYNNQLGPGRSPSLSGIESYGQVLQHLVDKAFRGLHARCPAHTSAVFKPVEKERVKSVVTVPQKYPWTEKYHMTRDVREEFAGVYQAAGEEEQPLDPVNDALRWMKECQHSYMDVQLDFWLLLRPLTDGSEECTQHLAWRLLSVWHWASAIYPAICPPVSLSLNIGYWLWNNCEVDDRQWWIEAYVCSLQCMAEASVG